MRLYSTYPLRDIIQMLAGEMFHEDREQLQREFLQPRAQYDLEIERHEEGHATLTIKVVK